MARDQHIKSSGRITNMNAGIRVDISYLIPEKAIPYQNMLKYNFKLSYLEEVVKFRDLL
jgi:hypothetical protein